MIPLIFARTELNASIVVKLLCLPPLHTPSRSSAHTVRCFNFYIYNTKSWNKLHANSPTYPVPNWQTAVTLQHTHTARISHTTRTAWPIFYTKRPNSACQAVNISPHITNSNTAINIGERIARIYRQSACKHWLHWTEQESVLRN